MTRVSILVTFLLLSGCKTLDSFCLVYQPIVVSKGDGTIQASAGVKRRILANELTYRETCK